MTTYACYPWWRNIGRPAALSIELVAILRLLSVSSPGKEGELGMGLVTPSGKRQPC